MSGATRKGGREVYSLHSGVAAGRRVVDEVDCKG